MQLLSMVRGYHICKDLGDASISEELCCQTEAENYTDPRHIKDDNHTKHVCTFVPETFIEINFHDNYLHSEKAKISTPHK